MNTTDYDCYDLTIIDYDALDLIEGNFTVGEDEDEGYYGWLTVYATEFVYCDLVPVLAE